MKRVLIFSLTYTPFIGGAEIAVQEITDRLRFQDVAFDVLTLRFDARLPTQEKIGNVTVHRLGFTRNDVSISDTYRFPLLINKYLFPFLAYVKARKLHAKHFYTVLWSIQANYAGFAALFTKRALPHVPFVLTLQEGDPPEHYARRAGFLRPLHKKIFHRANFVQTISEFLADYARAMGSAGPVAVIPNGVDVKRFMHEPPEETLRQVKDSFSKKSDEKYMVTVSRLVKKNGVDDCIRALTHLPQHVKLVVIGEGPDGLWLWHLAHKLGVIKRVWFTGHVSQEELPLYLSVSDIFVRPSRSEGMGISFIEAMAAGLPVIGTPVGGIPDFLYDPDTTKLGKVTPTGLFCRVNDPKSIAASVLRLLENEELRERIVENARAMVSEKYDWNMIAQRMYEEVLSVVEEARMTH